MITTTLPDVASVAPRRPTRRASTYTFDQLHRDLTPHPYRATLADTFQAIVTATDQDGTATSQTFYMNVTNVNDAFEMSSEHTVRDRGDVYDTEDHRHCRDNTDAA